jgi:TonB family protein
MIALNLHPAIGAPPDPPAGNRRGSFAATPEGHRGASGLPGNVSGTGNGENGISGKKNNGLPSGLYVGKAPANQSTAAVAGETSVNPNLMAGARPPRVSSAPARTSQAESSAKLSEAERQVFGQRKFYSLTLNMPNLNSAGGSWVIRFAEMKQQSTPGELSAPAAIHKVDPAYPLEVMRQNVAGTVILYGVIHADGTVSNVHVLHSVDDRLDEFASAAISQWQFQPATKNGAPVDVEATFQIPFHPARLKSNF